MAKRAAPKKKAARKKRVTPVPDDFSNISAYLTVTSVKKAMDFYQKAFGLKLQGEPMRAGRTIVHAVVRHGDSTIMLGPAARDGSYGSPASMGVSPHCFGLFVYVRNVDAHYKQVKRFKSVGPTEPMDMFWGDRMYTVVDPDGHQWTFASRKKMPTPEEMGEAMAAAMGGH
jgi:PhnB protein